MDKKKTNLFHEFSVKVSEFVGNAWTFCFAFSLTIIWMLTGPLFNFSDTWQLAINTLSSVITFLMVLLIQNTVNRDSKTLQLKIDELIRAHKLTHKSVIDLDKLSDAEIKELENKYLEISKQDPSNI